MFDYDLNRTSASGVSVRLRGDLVLGVPTERFRSCLEALTDRYAEIELDLSELRRADSAGLGALVRVHSDAHANGGLVRLVGAGKGIKDLLVLTKLVTVFSDDPRVAKTCQEELR
jgi:anti-anti-sigma factor